MTLAAGFGGLAILFALVFWSVWGNTASYVAFILLVPALVLGTTATTVKLVLRAVWAWALVAGAALMGLSFALQPGQASLPYAGDFLAFALAPLAALALAPITRRHLNVLRLSFICLLAALFAAGVGINGMLSGQYRVTAPQLSPIHFADLGIIFGFMALAGTLVAGPRWRFLLLAGPALGVIATIAAETRAALLVAVALAGLYGVVLLWRTKLHITAKFAIPLALMAGTLALFYIAYLVGFTRPWEALEPVFSVLQGQVPDDSSAAYRLDMYQAGLKAFLDAPLVGHGWREQIHAAAPYLSERGAAGFAAEGWAYIHSDALIFAVAAGLPGAVAYILFLSAPILACRSASKERSVLPAFYLGSTMSLGLFVGGLTDGLFTVEVIKTSVLFTAALLYWLVTPLQDKGDLA